MTINKKRFYMSIKVVISTESFYGKSNASGIYKQETELCSFYTIFNTYTVLEVTDVFDY